MKKISGILNNSQKVNLLLFLSSFIVYFFYFHHLFLNINSVLSSITGDTIKNYYTFISHVKNDDSVLHFSGMNYPFGEHVVYTDCQPLITFILKLLPFTHGYLIGISHALILLSLILTPLVLNAIFLRLNIDRFSSFFISLAVALLSPQIRRLDGHFALSYECVIPITILLLLKFFQESNRQKGIITLFFYNCALFLIHPYIGFGTSVLSFFSILVFSFLNFNKTSLLKNIFISFIAGVLPILLFKLFMYLTDLHENRTVEPDGIAMLVASIATVFVSNFGPFAGLLKKLISDGPQEYEGLSYIGIFTDALLLIFIVLAPFIARRLSFRKETLAIVVAASILLLFSFGLHNKLFEMLHIHTTIFNQFRTLGRFAWFFYYALPVFLIPVFYHTLKKTRWANFVKYIFGSLSILFLLFNLLEANSLLNIYSKTIFNDRNFFNDQCLNSEEKENIENIKKNNPQAIITLPRLYVGSEVYSRMGGNNVMIPAFIYSYHTGVPICGTFLSRTSISETEEGVGLLNAYKRNRKITNLLSGKPFLIITTNEDLLPDEQRLLKKVSVFQKNDSLQLGYVTQADLLKPVVNKSVFYDYKNHKENVDSLGVVFLKAENRRPYLPSKISDYEKAYEFDSLKIKSGKYIVSLHFHYTEKTFRGVYNHLIVVKTNHKESVWQYTKAIRLFSGFYNGFAVFEYPIELLRENKYEFLLNGFGDKPYRISDFMIRPDTIDVGFVNKNGDTTINNFPH